MNEIDNTACMEVFEVVKKLPEEQQKLIPKKIIDNLKKNAINESYELKYDNVGNIILSKDAESMLVYLYSEYIITSDTVREQIKKKTKQNKLIKDNIKKANITINYDYNKINDNSNININEQKNNVAMVKYEKNIFKKLLNKIKRIFKK